MDGLILLAAAIAGAAGAVYLIRLIRRVVLWLRFRRGRQGEIEARGILEDAGYTIVDQQQDAQGTVLVDGTPYSFGVRADFIVTKGSNTYVAEVKTGRRAPDPAHAPTRRQLLEYAMAYDPDGILLVDADSRTIHTIEFQFDGRAVKQSGGFWRRLRDLAAALAFATGLCLWLAARPASGEPLLWLPAGTRPLADEQTASYVNVVGQRLAEQAGGPDIRFSFTVLDLPAQAEVVSASDGSVFICSGLFEQLESEDQLAFLIGRAVAQTVERHGEKQMLAETFSMLISLAGSFALMNGMGILGQDNMTVQLTKSDEASADAMSLAYLRRAGYSADQAVARYFQQRRLYEAYSERTMPLLMPAPTTEYRWRKIKKRIRVDAAQEQSTGNAPPMLQPADYQARFWPKAADDIAQAALAAAREHLLARREQSLSRLRQTVHTDYNKSGFIFKPEFIQRIQESWRGVLLRDMDIRSLTADVYHSQFAVVYCDAVIRDELSDRSAQTRINERWILVPEEGAWKLWAVKRY